jgi:hypothetical protein
MTGIQHSVLRRLVLLLALVGGFMALSSATPQSALAIQDDESYLLVWTEGSGSVNLTGGYVCSDPHCSFGPYNTEVQPLINASADPDPGWKFSHWDAQAGVDAGDLCYGSTFYVCQVNFISYPYTWAYFTAVFVPDIQINPVTYPLTVTLAGAGHGSVGAPLGIECPLDCSHDFIGGSTVTLTAYAGPLSAFAGWSGACSGSGSTCQVTMSQSRNVTATFNADIPLGDPALTRTLEVHLAGDGSGTVSSGQAIACPGDCSQDYQIAADVTLTATPAAGSVFAGWSGNCSGFASTCVVTMSSSRNVTATFEPAPAGGGQPDPGQPNPGQPDPGQPDPGQPDPGQPQPQGCTITGTPGDDVLTGTPAADVICGLSGKDTLVGLGGDDVLLGGDGADTLLGGGGKDVLTGGKGSDELVGGKGNDRLTGGAGRDHLAGAGGKDTLLARDGKGDLVDGGAGTDKARVDAKKDVRKALESIL